MQRPAFRMATGAIASLLLAGIAAGAEQPAVAPTEVVQAKEAGGGTFEYRMQLLRTTPTHRVFKVTYPSPVHSELESNNTIPAEYYLPNGIKPGDPRRPGVICLHILGGNFELVRLLCAVFADRGIPAVMFKLPYYGERAERGVRRMLEKDAGLFAEALHQSIADIRRTTDFLASRPEINPERIGISGISLGAIVGATACGKVPRLWRAGLILGGGDLHTIIHHARETRGLSAFIKAQPPAEQQRIEGLIAKMDPLLQRERLQALGRQGRVLMVNAAEDEVVPRRCTEQLAEAAGISDKVVWLDGLAHYTAMAALPSILQQLGDFFAQDLPKGITPPAATSLKSLPPEHRLARFVREVITLIGPSPNKGRCHLALLQADIAEKGKKTRGYDLDLVRGAGDRFRLACTIPKVGKVALGNGASPWLQSQDGTCFVGSIKDADNRALPTYLNPQFLLKARVAWGALSAMTISPNAFRNYLTVTAKRDAKGNEVLGLDIHHRHTRGKAEITFAKDGTTPTSLTFAVDGTTGTVHFRQWQIDTIATDELFAPPGSKHKPVRREDICRMFAAIFNIIGENVQ